MRKKTIDTYLSNVNRINLDYQCRVVENAADVQNVLAIEKEVFPTSVQDDLDLLLEFFANDEAHGLLLMKGNRVIGAAKGEHIGEENTEPAMLEHPLIQPNLDETFYVDSMAIIKDERSTKVLDFLIHEAIVDLKRFDYRYVALHGRRKGGISRLYQQRYKVSVLKTYPKWKVYEEPVDFLLIDLEKLPTQAAWRRILYRIIKRFYRKFIRG